MDILDEYPTKAILEIAEVLLIGKKQGHKPGSWRHISTQEHILAAIGHLISHLRGKADENHLGHALCRIAMAVDITKREEK